MQEAWATAKEIAAALKVSLPEIRKLTRAGVPCLRVGRLVRFNRSEVEAWLRARAEQKRNGAAAEEVEDARKPAQ